MNNILARFNTANIDSLTDSFNWTTRLVLGLPEGDGAVVTGDVDANMAEACARFLESLAKEPTASALALSTEIYCLTYISIAKQ